MNVIVIIFFECDVCSMFFGTDTQTSIFQYFSTQKKIFPLINFDYFDVHKVYNLFKILKIQRFLLICNLNDAGDCISLKFSSQL